MNPEDRMRKWLLLGLLGAAVVFYVSLQEDDGPGVLGPGTGTLSAQAPAALPPTPDETVLALLPVLERQDPQARREALAGLEGMLDPETKSRLSAQTLEKTADALIACYRQAGEEEVEARGQALKLAVARVGGDAARGFAEELMGSTTEPVRLAAVKAWLESGAVNGKALREKAAELARSDSVPDELKPRVLRKALGKKSETELLALLDTALDGPALAACAVEVQNLGKPQLLAPILSRLDEAGLTGSADRLPWLSGGLLAQHIRIAEGDDLKRALKVAGLRRSLTKATAKAVQSRAGHPDATVRRMVARIIPGAVRTEGLDVASGEELLLARLKEETDPAVKGEIEGSLAEVRKTRPAQEAAPATPAVP